MSEPSQFSFRNKQNEAIVPSSSQQNTVLGRSGASSAGRMELGVKDDFKAWKEDLQIAIENLAEDTGHRILLWNEAKSDVQTYLYDQWCFLKDSDDRIESILESALYFEEELKQEKAILEARMTELVHTLVAGCPTAAANRDAGETSSSSSRNMNF